MITKYKNLHLGLSAVVVLVAALFYGMNPEVLLPYVFNFGVEDLELKNIFRAIMGLYLGFGTYWIMGMVKAKYWEGATISNSVFMGGLALGRLLSTFLDGVSTLWITGMFLELLMMVWGIHNLRIFGNND